MPYLINMTKGCDRNLIPILRATLLIGRDEESDVNLGGSVISRNHATIVFDSKNYWLRDNGSTNGSYVNGKRVTAKLLHHLDKICFGPYEFIFDLHGPAVSKEPEPIQLMDESEKVKINLTEAHNPEQCTLTFDIQAEDDVTDEELYVGRGMQPIRHSFNRHPSIRILTKGVRPRMAACAKSAN